MYATVSLPFVPVVQPLFFQHLSASAWLTFLSARPSPANAMLRDILFFGISVPLKSVCLSVDSFAAYTSPNPLPVLMTPGVACFEPVLPLPAETIPSASAAPRTRSVGPPTFHRRFRDTPDSFLPSIVPPFMSLPQLVFSVSSV